MADGGPIRAQVALDLRTALTVHRRTVHRVLVLAGILIIALVTGFLLTLLLARPSLESLVATAAEGTRLATWQLLLASSWALVPVLLMVGAAVVYIGMVLRYADGAHTGRAVLDGHAWRATVRRLPHASMAVLTVGVCAVVAAGLAPVISVVSLLALGVTPIVRRRWPSKRWPSTRSLVGMAVPLGAAAVVAVRGAMALPEVFLAGSGVRDGLRAGWDRTRGQIRRVAMVLVAAAVAAMAGMWALIAISMPIGHPTFALVLEMSGTVLFAPLPIVALLVLYRATGGTSTPDPVTPRLGEPGPVMPSVLSFALLATLVVPSAAPARAEDGPEQEVAFTVSAGGTWNFGDAVTVDGAVTSGEDDHPTGTVALWMQRDQADPGHPEDWSDPVEFDSSGLTTDDDGEFSFDGSTLPGGRLRLWVTYEPDDDVHAPMEADPVAVTVDVRFVSSETFVDPDPFGDPVPTYTIAGDPIRVFVEIPNQVVHADGMVDAAPMQSIGFRRRNAEDDSTVWIGSATLQRDEDAYEDEVEWIYWAEIDHVLVDRSVTWYFEAVVLDDETSYGLANNPTVITRDLVEPAASAVTLLAPAEVEYGGEATFHVEVSGPAGVSTAGQIDLQYDDGGGFTTFSSGHALTNGALEVTLCASDDDVCAPGGPRLPFADEDSEPLTVRAEYRPAGISADPSRNALHPSTSASHTIAVDDLGAGMCRTVDLVPRRLGLGDDVEFGDPQILTRSNCDDGGYLGGTNIALDAQPVEGFEVARWEHRGEVVSTEDRLVLRLPIEDLEEWETERIFVYYQLVCHDIRAEVTGSGTAGRVLAMGNPWLGWGSFDDHGGCEHEDGTRGVLYGSDVRVEARALMNPATGEFDAFRGLGTIPVDHEHTTEEFTSIGTLQVVSFTVVRDVVVPFDYGPVCRTVLTPSGEFGGAQLLTAPNCDSPEGSGYLRDSSVTASARIDDDQAILAGWLLDGEQLAGAGAASQVTFTVGAAPTTTIEPEFSWCHPVQVWERTTDAPWHGGSAIVDVRPAPNCFDGSQRWLHGTELTLMPIHSASYRFGGWSDADGAEGPQVRGTVGDRGVRRVVLDDPLETTAHFYMPQVCSEIHMWGSEGTRLGFDDVRFPDSGCGPGQYYDEAKRDIHVSHDPVSRNDYMGHTVGSRAFNYTPLLMEIHNDRLLAATGSVTMRQTFARPPAWSSGQVPFECTPPRVAQAGDGSWVRTSVTQCWLLVRGDLTIRLDQCQGLEPTVNITRAGDDSGRVFGPRDAGILDHQWITGSASSGVQECASPFADDRNFWYPGSEVTLRAQAPAVGFEFLDWGHVDFDTGVELFLDEDPGEGRAPLGINVLTNDQRPTIRATVNYRAHCGTLSHGTNIRVEAPRPNCPGNTGGELGYLVGTFVQVSADRTRGGRDFERFRGVVADTTGIDDNNRPSALVLIRGDTTVSAVYPTGTDRFLSALGTVGKFAVAVGALATVAGATVACPPCGVALTALTASVFLAELIPGVGGWASAALDLVNPLSVLECAAKWGFGTTGSSGESEFGGATATGSTAIKSIRFAYEASTSGTERAIGTITARSSTAAVGAGVQFAYGLYEHRIDQMDLNYQSVEQLRDTATWNSCMNDKYRAAT